MVIFKLVKLIGIGIGIFVILFVVFFALLKAGMSTETLFNSGLGYVIIGGLVLAGLGIGSAKNRSKLK